MFSPSWYLSLLLFGSVVEALTSNEILISGLAARATDPTLFYYVFAVSLATLVGSVLLGMKGCSCTGRNSGEKTKLLSKAVEEARDPTLDNPEDLADWRCMAGGYLLGALNNSSYCIVMGASQELAKQFHAEDFMSLFSNALMVTAFLGTMFNGAFLLQVRFSFRVLMLNLMLVGGYLILALSSQIGGLAGFAVAVFACILVSLAQIIGELGMLVFFKQFPPIVLGGWSGGTGLAGIGGGSIYLFLLGIGLSNAQIFILLIPSSIVYYMTFRYLENRLQRCGLSADVSDAGPADAEGSKVSFSSIMEVFQYCWPIIGCIVSVYFMTYTIYPGLVDRATLCPVDASFTAAHAFTTMWIAYNAGVTFNSFLFINGVRTDHLWFFPTMHILSTSFWVFEAVTHTVLNTFGHAGYYMGFVSMFWVGVIGGASYVNGVNAFNNRPGLRPEIRELGISVTFTMSNMFLMFATVLGGVLHQTLLRSSVVYPNGCPAI